MRNRILSFIIGILLLSATALTGCQFIEHNSEKDLKQIVATIASVEDKGFSSGERHIYKYELITEVNRRFSNSGQVPTEQNIDDVLQNMVDNELLSIEVERLIFKGELDWRDGSKLYTDIDGELTGVVGGEYRDYTDVNKINRMLYDTIDETLRSIQKEILTSYNEELAEDGERAPEPSPTYPVREAETHDTVFPETTLWEPEFSRIPASFGNDDKVSRERQAVARLVTNIIKTVEDSYKDHDATKLQEAKDSYADRIAKKQYAELYLELADSYPIQFLAGDDTLQQVQSEAMQEFLTKKANIEVSNDEVEQRYKSKLETQMLNFSTESNYETAIGGSDIILYRPNSDYFYVKHILVPFSEAQAAELTKFKARPNTTTAQIAEFRDRLVSGIVAYPHPDGNEDFTKPTSARAIFDEVRAAVGQASSIVKEAERKFDDYIYLYNTDPGAFSNASGYALKKVLGKYEQQTYMTEFEDGARDLYKNYQPGQVLDYYVVTDYGVHIMYYAQDTENGSIKQIGSYETPGEYKKVFDVLEAEIYTAKQGIALNTWQQAALVERTQNDDYVKTFKNRYKDILKK